MKASVSPEPQKSLQRGSRWKTQSFRDHVSGYLYIAPFFLVFLCFTLFPVAWGLYISFFKYPLIGQQEFTGLQNYIWLITDDPKFWQSVRNTFSIWALSTIPQLFFALVLAAVLNTNVKGRGFFRVSMIVPNVTSLVAVAIIFTSIFGYHYGLINYFLNELFGMENFDWGASYFGAQLVVAMMVMWRWTGYNAVIYLAALQSIPNDLYEAATLDGANKVQQFFYITIPMIRPMIIFTVIVSTIGGMGIFVEPLIFGGSYQGGAQGQVSTMVLYLFDSAFTKNAFGYASAVGWVMFLIVGVFSALNYYLTKKIQSAD
jgi:cellobiose transport system permease protein